MNNDLNSNQNNNLFPDSKTLEQPVSHEVLFETDEVPVIMESNKKKSNKTFILIIVLVIFLSFSASGGAVYFLTQNNQNKNSANNFNGSNTLPSNPIENEEQDNKEENNQNNIDSEEEKEEEVKPPVVPVTLTNEELNAYLDYMPLNIILDDSIMPINTTKFLVDNIDKKILFSKALMISSEEDWEYVPCNITNGCSIEKLSEYAVMGKMIDNVYAFHHISNNNANNVLRKIYNISLSDLNTKLSTNQKELIPVGNWCYISFDNGFVQSECRGGNGHSLIYVMDNYEANNSELIIYSNIILKYYSSFSDLYTEKDIFVEDGMDIKDYVLQHKDDFTLYKHTFKKNELGYYWYSTEVVS